MMKVNALLVGTFCFLSFVSSAMAESVIHGKVEIKKGFENKISPTAALYIIARPNGAQGGPPAAVKRIVGPLRFPIEFELSSKDAMIPETPMEGSFTLIARISQKGSATPANPGDLQTSKPLNGVKPGGKSVTLKIDEERN